MIFKLNKRVKYNTALFILPFSIFCLLTFLIYWSSIFSGFMGDDYIHCHYFIETTVIERLQGLVTCFWDVIASVKGVFGFYRPLFHFWITTNYSLFKTNPIGWHILHITFHGLNVFLFYLFLFKFIRILRIKNMREITFAFLGGLFFCVSPINYFTTCWLSGAHDQMVTFFFLLSLNQYMKFRKTGERKSFLLSIMFYAFSLLSKETASTFITIFFLIEILLSFKARAKKVPIIRRLSYISIYGVIFLSYLIIRRIILGGSIIGYDITYAKYFFTNNLNTLIDEFLLFPSSTRVEKLDFFFLRKILLIAMVFLLFTQGNIKAILSRIKLILFGVIWALVISLPTLPFQFGIWRFYPATLGLFLSLAVLLTPPKRLIIKRDFFNSQILIPLKIIFLILILLLINTSHQILKVRIDKYVTDQKKELKFFPQLKKQLPDIENDAIIYFLNPYKAVSKIFGLSQMMVTYNKRLDVQCFEFAVLHSVKPSLLHKTYFLEWDEKGSKFIFRNDIKKNVAELFSKYRYNPYASWDFRGFKTAPPELKETGCFEFSSENLGDCKGVLVVFRINNFFDVMENDVEVRLSAIPASQKSNVRFFYAYSIPPLKMNSWHFIPLDIDVEGNFKTFRLKLEPEKKYKDIFWWDGKIFRMGLQFEGPFKYVKIDYLHSFK